jgi:hypothetical protein
MQDYPDLLFELISPIHVWIRLLDQLELIFVPSQIPHRFLIHSQMPPNSHSKLKTLQQGVIQKRIEYERRNFMIKLAVIGSTLATVLVMGSMTTPTYAASNPADDPSTYSYNTGKQSYEARMAEDHPWFDNEDEETTANYSFRDGLSKAQNRKNAFAAMPTGDDLTDEELAAFFSANGLGSGSAYSNGVYDEAAKSEYGFYAGQSAYEQRHASFANG